MQKLILISLGLLFFSLQLMAQPRTITGRIINANGTGVASASVTVKGTNTGTSTETDGSFSLEVPAGARTLLVSSVGFEDQEFTLGNSSNNIVITLGSTERSMDEVVVVAYGQQQRKAVTGAISSVGAEKIQRQQVVSATQALQGLATGVLVINTTGQPGDNPTIRIRGIGSVNASADPLIVVDGIAFNGNLNTINPNDIESMNVLKDATATSLYGSRAANGVILVTTKQGRKGKAPEINFYSSYGVSSRAVKEYPFVTSEEYMKLAWEANWNEAKYDLGLPNPGTYATSNLLTGGRGLQYNPYNVANPIDTNGNLVPGATLLWNTDWTKEVSNNSATRKNIGVNISGGSDMFRYFLSTDYLDQDGYVIKSNFKRVTARFNGQADLRSWLGIGMNMSVSSSNQNYPDQSGTAFRNAVSFGRRLSSIYPLYMRDDNGALLLDAGGDPQFDFGNNLGVGRTLNHNRPVAQQVNSVAVQLSDQNLNDRLQTSMSTFGEVKFTRNLRLRSNFGIDRYVFSNFFYQNPTFGDAAGVGGRVSRGRDLTTAWTWNNMLNYEQNFGDHHIGAMVSSEAYDYKGEELSADRTGFPLPGLFELGSGATLEDSRSATNRTRLESYLGRLTYNFDNRYFLEATVRRDGSSRFAPEQRWGTFFAIGGSWAISDENFIQGIGFINLLKLRANYGEVGNSALTSYFPYLSAFSTGWNDLNYPGVIISGLGNPNITWEKMGTYNIGIDFAVLKNRLNGSIEYYNKNTFDLLFNRPLPSSSGFTDIDENIGAVRNSGIEITLNSRNVARKDFSWSTDFNLATLKNEITRLPQAFIPNGAFRLEVGKSLNQHFIYEWAGVNQENGRPQWYKDEVVNGVPTGKKIVVNNNSDATRYYFGSALPKVTGGLNNSFAYRSFDLSFLFNYAFGGKVLDTDYIGLMHGFSDVGGQLHRDILDRWQKPGDVTDVPRLSFQNLSYGEPSTRHLFSGDYVRLRNITIGYTLPATLIGRQKVLQNFRFYVQADNFFTWTKAKAGMDPELNITGRTNNRSSTFKTVSAGLNVGF